MLYSLNDICIIPARVSDIESRSECNPYYSNGMLPLFTAPMSCIVDDKNWTEFEKNKINSIIPRNIPLDKRYSLMDQTFVAMSLGEFESSFCKEVIFSTPSYICIDIANGHMQKLLDLCSKAKELHGSNLIIMAGNIANPDTYLEYAKVGIDYVRIGIGSGNVCTTSANGGVHYPMASLIQECAEYKNNVYKNIHFDGENTVNICSPYKSIPKIVADGGFKNFDHIIKALALGADYVMCGEIFAKAWEACGPVFMHTDSDNPIINDVYLNTYKDKCGWIGLVNRPELGLCIPHRQYYGMSTKRAQKEFGNTELKTAEGIIKQIRVDYTLSGWVENFIHYLRSTMSYTNTREINALQKVHTAIISNSAFSSYNK